jgi:hypothetical protein
MTYATLQQDVPIILELPDMHVARDRKESEINKF